MDVESFHAGTEGCRFEAEALGSTSGTADLPAALLESPRNVPALYCFKFSVVLLEGRRYLRRPQRLVRRRTFLFAG
jgi:hypothetical protein